MKPNNLLRRERELRGWSQARVAEEIDTSALNISRWERGISMPYPHFREKLCALFRKDAAALGLLESEEEPVGLFLSPLVSTQAGSLPASAVLDPTIPLPPPGNVRLVGRDGLLGRLKESLCGDAKPVSVALNGLPGVGKTALAVNLACDSEVRTHFQDGVLWAGLGLKPDLTEMLSRWGTLLGVSLTDVGKQGDSESWARAIRSAIGWRQMLLVIDDVWEIEDALAFQVGGPCCAYLATTRYPHLAAQLAMDGALAVPELVDHDGLALLSRYAGEFVTQAPETALALVRSVGALPLALTLIGKYLSVQVYSGQPRRLNAAVEHLRDARARLQLSEARALAERHPSISSGTPFSLQSVIAVSEHLLDEAGRSALHALSVFPAKPNSFSEEAALDVCQTSLETLDALCDAGLVESNGPSRYTLHQTVADYARALLTDPVTSERLVSYYVRFVETNANKHAMLVSETSNILAAFEYAYQTHHRAELARGVCAFAGFLLMRGLYNLAGKHLRRAYEAASALGDPRCLIDTLVHLGLVEQASGHMVQAVASLNEALALAREIDYKEQICDLLRNLGKVESEWGNYERAELYYIEGLELAKELDQQVQMCRLLTGLGVIAGKRGHYALGESYFQQGLELARRLELHERIATLLMNLGWMEMERGSYQQAESFYLSCLSIARQYGYDELCGSAQANLSLLLRKQGRYAECYDCLNAALALYRNVGNHLYMNQTLAGLGALASARGDDVLARQYLQESMDFARRFDYREMKGPYATFMGELETRQGNYEKAEAYLQEALEFTRAVGEIYEIMTTLYARGELFLRLKRIDEAERTFEEMQACAPIEHLELHARALFGQARVAQLRGDLVTARQQGETCLRRFQELGHRCSAEVARWLDEIRLSA